MYDIVLAIDLMCSVRVYLCVRVRARVRVPDVANFGVDCIIIVVKRVVQLLRCSLTALS